MLQKSSIISSLHNFNIRIVLSGVIRIRSISPDDVFLDDAHDVSPKTLRIFRAHSPAEVLDFLVLLHPDGADLFAVVEGALVGVAMQKERPDYLPQGRFKATEEHTLPQEEVVLHLTFLVQQVTPDHGRYHGHLALLWVQFVASDFGSAHHEVPAKGHYSILNSFKLTKP